MTPTAIVDQARGWSRDIVNADVRGPGDLENAMRRAESRWGIPFAAMWALRYRPPKDVAASIYLRLRDAHAAMCEAQMRKFKDELDKTRRECGRDALLVRAAVAVAGQDRPASEG
jgi:hypothetical protein